MQQKTLFTAARFYEPASKPKDTLVGLICLVVCLITTHQISAQQFQATPLLHPDGAFISVALNDSGQIAGTLIVNDSTIHAVRREADGQFTNLPELAGNLSEATGMNELGDIVGSTVDGNGGVHTGVWENGSFRELQVPVGAIIHPLARDLNKQGVAAGFFTDSANLAHAVVWDANGNVQNLPELNGVQSFALAINETGEIAGIIGLADGTNRAILWQPNGGGYQAMDLGP